MGAAAVLDTAAETPPIRKSIAKPAKPFSDGAWTNTGEVDDAINDISGVDWHALVIAYWNPALE
jgi:hypothetical protein